MSAAQGTNGDAKANGHQPDDANGAARSSSPPVHHPAEPVPPADKHPTAADASPSKDSRGTASAGTSAAPSPASSRRRFLPSLPRLGHRDHGSGGLHGLLGHGSPAHKDLEAAREAEISNVLDVVHWKCEDVCRFIDALGLEKYTPEFTVNKVDGAKFLQLDGSRLKALGIQNHSDRSVIKKRVKYIKVRIEKERKLLEKQNKQLAKMDKKGKRL